MPGTRLRKLLLLGGVLAADSLAFGGKFGARPLQGRRQRTCVRAGIRQEENKGESHGALGPRRALDRC